MPALVGAFGFCRAADGRAREPAPVKINPFDSVIPKLKDVTQYWRTILRSGVIGTFIGILPGVGEDVAAWSSYAAREARQQGEGEVRQGLDRRPDGGGDRRQRVRAGRGDSRC